MKRRFFIEPSAINDLTAVISGSDANHIKNVLRLKSGDKIVLFDGTGAEYEAEIMAISPDRVEVAVNQSLASTNTESSLEMIIAQAFLKERKMDDLIRHLTELGITKWIPFFAARSVPKPLKNRMISRTERWKKIATESLKQCRRTRVPDISLPVSFEEALQTGKNCDAKLIFWESETGFDSFDFSNNNESYHKIFAMIGPEGGFTSQEVEIAKESGYVTVSLGPRILRAETATIAACTLLQYFFGDMNKKNIDNNRYFY